MDKIKFNNIKFISIKPRKSLLCTSYFSQIKFDIFLKVNLFVIKFFAD